LERIMTSSAVSAQGTKLYVSGTQGSAVILTGITKAKPAVCAAINTLAIGDVVLFGAVTGMPEINGVLGVVTVASGASFTVNVDASGFSAAGTAGTCTPQTWTKVSGVKTYSGYDGQAAEIDATDFDSVAKEVVLGLQDMGNIQIDVNVLPMDAGQLAIRAAKTSGTKLGYRIVASDGITEAFFAYCKKFSIASGVDQIKKGTIGLRITGAVATN
jgi:hypothetical protein